MQLKNILLLVCILSCSALNSLSSCEGDCEGKFYLKLGSGVSFSQRLHVKALLPFWDTAQQGYNASVGTRPILGMGLGYEINPCYSLDLTLSNRPQYKYRKFQIPIPGTATPGFLGTKTRKFDLDISTLMLTGYLSGQNFGCTCWNIGSGAIYPVFGAGVGVSRVNIYNFRATGLPSVNPVADPSAAFSSENEYTLRYVLSYQIMAGLEYRYCDQWSLSMGYRWFDVASFKASRYLRSANGSALDIGGDNMMKIKFAAQELFIEFKVFI